MIERFGNAVLEAGSLVLTDRRWTAPLSAIAIGFGLFVGIAIGPGSTPTFAGGGQVITVMVPPEAPAPAAPPASAPAPAPAPGPVTGTAPTPVAQSAPASPPPTSRAPGGKPGPKKPTGPFLTGTVVQRNTVAGSYSLAAPGGQLYAIHASSLPVRGTRVKTAFRPLANGTYAERGKRTRSGLATSAEVSGVVTFVDSVTPRGAYTLSAPGVSLWVRTPAASRQIAPPVGSFATAQVGLESPPPPSAPVPVPVPQAPDEGTATPPVAPPNQLPVQPTAPATSQPASCARVTAPPASPPESVLVQRSVVSEQALSTYGELGGTVQAICPSTSQLLISADAIREGGQDVSIAVPPGFDLTRLSVDDPVVATAAIAADGALSLSGLASDKGITGANDPSALQGDLQGG